MGDRLDVNNDAYKYGAVIIEKNLITDWNVQVNGIL
jgi:hypothetical protein